MSIKNRRMSVAHPPVFYYKSTIKVKVKIYFATENL